MQSSGIYYIYVVQPSPPSISKILFIFQNRNSLTIKQSLPFSFPQPLTSTIILLLLIYCAFPTGSRARSPGPGRPSRASTPLVPASADLLTTPPSLRERPGLSRHERGRRAHDHDTRVCAHRARAHRRAPHACARGASASFAADRAADGP